MKPISSGTTRREVQDIDTVTPFVDFYSETLASTVRIVPDGQNLIASIAGRRHIDDIFGIGGTQEEAVEDLTVALWETLEELGSDVQRLSPHLIRQLAALRRLKAQVSELEDATRAMSMRWTTRAKLLLPEATTVAAVA